MTENKRMLRAARAMGHVSFHSNHWFLRRALQWLSEMLGDIHLEYLEGLGWSVATCRMDGEWDDWVHGDKPEYALAEAVLKVAAEKQ